MDVIKGEFKVLSECRKVHALKLHNDGSIFLFSCACMLSTVFLNLWVSSFKHSKCT